MERSAPVAAVRARCARLGASVDLCLAIREHLAEWETPFVELGAFGTADPAAIAAAIDRFCVEALGQPVAGAVFYGSSIGAVAGRARGAGGRVVLKVHQPGVRLERLRAIQPVMAALAGAGFPCPRPLVAPRPLALGHATVEELLDRGGPADAHEPWARRELARRLAELVRLVPTERRSPALGRSWFGGLPADRVFPRPHSRLFDFEATRAGAEWIDALAAEARRVPLAGERVVGHFDWRVEHARFETGELTAAYDWDSLHFELEPVMVGASAHAFTADWTRDAIPPAPSADEIRAFVADYEAARGARFGVDERRVVAASCVYSIAYTARCGHALAPERGPPSRPLEPAATGGRDFAFRRLLRDAGRSLLDEGV